MVTERRPTAHAEHKKLASTEVLRAVVLRLHEAFPRLCKLWNEQSSMRRNWALLFERLDVDGSGRLDFDEFTNAGANELEVEGELDHMKALWAYIDHDNSGEVSIKEFQHAT